VAWALKGIFAGLGDNFVTNSEPKAVNIANY
jgi:hypothetical protein